MENFLEKNTSWSFCVCPFLSGLVLSVFFWDFVDPFMGISIEEALNEKYNMFRDTES